MHRKSKETYLKEKLFFEKKSILCFRLALFSPFASLKYKKM